jgi:opacity protein-like surface antigen
VTGAATAIGTALLTLAMASGVGAQSRTQPRRPAPVRPDPPVSVRGFVEAGVRTFTASQGFDAVLGTHRGTIVGGGVEAVLGRHLFVSFGVSQFQKDGERAFVHEGEVFPLGIDTTITIVPIEISAGYRFSNPRRRLTPYVGGGLAWHRYEETSEFAASGEDAAFTKAGLQVLGGVEWKAARWVGVAGEGTWMRVPDAFADLPTSAAAAFGETDLGGASVRVKLVIGR